MSVNAWLHPLVVRLSCAADTDLMAPLDEPRPLSAREREVLDALLRADFPGAEQSRRLARDATVVEECGCGCPTIYFSTGREQHWPAVEAYTKLETYEEVILFISDSGLWALEWSGGAAPAEFPPAAGLTVWVPPGHKGPLQPIRGQFDRWFLASSQHPGGPRQAAVMPGEDCQLW